MQATRGRINAARPQSSLTAIKEASCVPPQRAKNGQQFQRDPALLGLVLSLSPPVV